MGSRMSAGPQYPFAGIGLPDAQTIAPGSTEFFPIGFPARQTVERPFSQLAPAHWHVVRELLFI
jgi:hypothetical protein